MGAPAPAPPVPAAPAPQPPPAPGPITDALTGDYDLALYVGSGCGVIQEAERIRRYTATVTSPSEAKYVVTLTSGKFLQGRLCDNPTGLNCNQFAAERTGDLIRFDLANNNDDGFGGHIVEQRVPGGWNGQKYTLLGPTVSIIGRSPGRLRSP